MEEGTGDDVAVPGGEIGVGVDLGDLLGSTDGWTPGSESVSSDNIVNAVTLLPPGLAGDSKASPVFSLNAWDVFSKLRGKPISNHNPVTESFCKKRPGGD